ncbi:cysteine hydrolase [Termitidicoccus mucosus]|uniref:Cysteine hydrolase n=1 Tax=Termitidicoccus mucosus TaxID=1184151 RepID=A0A178IL08_9BACT|nr:cysteine hydrolase [Opitutaceae bacterium TSB47]
MPRIRVPRYLAAALGMLAGLGAYVVHISNAFSYLSDDPAACVNCHIMGSYYASHAHSSHKGAATCNDCHVPHTGVFAKYAFKARDGLYHASVFTLRGEPQAMMIKEAGANVVQANCVRCHGRLNEIVAPGAPVTLAGKLHGEGHLCWDCHRDVPHGTVRSISSAPDAIVPYPESAMPAWLRAARGESPSPLPR